MNHRLGVSVVGGEQFPTGGGPPQAGSPRAAPGSGKIWSKARADGKVRMGEGTGVA